MLYREQGRGQRCTAELYPHNGCVYLFVYVDVDDYAQTHTAHDERGRLQREPVRPAFEIVFVSTRAAGTLDLYAKGERRWRIALRDLFCEHILGCDAPVCEPEKREYTLSGLLDRGSGLTVDPARGITAADPKVPLLVTEGCKKALKADQEGFACVVLSGCCAWKGTRAGTASHPTRAATTRTCSPRRCRARFAGPSGVRTNRAPHGNRRVYRQCLFFRPARPEPTSRARQVVRILQYP